MIKPNQAALTSATGNAKSQNAAANSGAFEVSSPEEIRSNRENFRRVCSGTLRKQPPRRGRNIGPTTYKLVDPVSFAESRGLILVKAIPPRPVCFSLDGNFPLKRTRGSPAGQGEDNPATEENRKYQLSTDENESAVSGRGGT